MHAIRRDLRNCLRLGLYFATAFTAAAAAALLIGALVYVAQHRSDEFQRALSQLPIASIAVVGSYYVAGILGGTSYYLLQSFTHTYLGQVLFAFVLSAIAYGTILLTGTLAFVYFNLNMFGFPSPAEAWFILPRATLAIACIQALIGPPIWRLRNP